MISSTFVYAHKHIGKWSPRPLWGRAARVSFIAALVLVFSPGAFFAHPYEPGYYSLRSALRVDPARGLQVMAVAEVPNTDMLQAFVDRFGFADEYEQEQIDGFIASYFDLFAEGLSVEVNGRAIEGRWEALDDARNGRVGEQGLFIFMVEFVAESPLEPCAEDLEIAVHVTAFEGEEAFFSASVEALAPWRVLRSSAREVIGEVSGAQDVNECFECWSRDESLRHSRALFSRSEPGSPEGTAQGSVTQP